jgi:hypothetical protein
MNIPLRNFPKPEPARQRPDCGLSERNAIIAEACNKVNELLEYAYGYEHTRVLVPAQSNIDERMPMYFLRPCIDALNDLVQDLDLDVFPMAQIGMNMDYHGFIPWTNLIAEQINLILEKL